MNSTIKVSSCLLCITMRSVKENTNFEDSYGGPSRDNCGPESMLFVRQVKAVQPVNCMSPLEGCYDSRRV